MLRSYRNMCNDLCMSTSTDMNADLSFDIADRMRKALRVSGCGVQEMADYLDVARNTVGTWINGKVAPTGPSLRLFALRTGVPLAWLKDGDVSDETGTDPDGGPAVDRVNKSLPNTVVTFPTSAPVLVAA